MTTKNISGPEGPVTSKAFDPWTGTFDEMQEANLFSALPDADPARPLYQWYGAQLIQSMRSEAEESGFAVLACVRRCANHDLVMPEWLARVFIRRYDAVLTCRADSWDSPLAFGKPYPKGKHLSALRAARAHRMDVYNRVNAAILRNPEKALGVKLFREVGNEIGLKSTAVQNYHYEATKFIGHGAKGALRRRTETRWLSQAAASKRVAAVKWGAR